MKTGLSKKQKATNIYFNEDSPIIEVCTYNTDLKNRLTRYAAQYPSECSLIDDDEMGCLTAARPQESWQRSTPRICKEKRSNFPPAVRGRNPAGGVFIWMNESLQFHY